MVHIICHIVGLNNLLKISFISEINKKYPDIVIQDLDAITNDIRNIPDMIALNDSFMKTQKNSKNHNVAMKKIHSFWKSSFSTKINNILKRHHNNKLIFIGLSTYHKNHKLKINIDTKNLFFLKLDPKKNAQNIVEFNLDKYKKHIIDGIFPLKYLDHAFMIEQRNKLIDIYSNLGFKLKSFNTLLKWIDLYMLQFNSPNSPNSDVTKFIDNIVGYPPSEIFIGSVDDFVDVIHIKRAVGVRKNKNKKILSSIFASNPKFANTTSTCNIGELIGYTQKWLALLYAIKGVNNYVKKGFSSNNSPYIKEKFVGSFDILKKSCFLYMTVGDSFVDKIGWCKYKSSQSVPIKYKEFIENIYDELLELGVRFINY